MWLAGIDEAGRGCLCGSLFVAGVIGKAHIIKSFGAKDSKKLSPKRREILYEAMCEARERGDLAFFVVEIDAEEIDANGLSSAMRKGIESVMSAIGNYALAGQILQKSIFKMAQDSQDWQVLQDSKESVDRVEQEKAQVSESSQCNVVHNSAIGANELVVIIDGNTTFKAQIPQYLLNAGLKMQTLVKADSLFEVVSCASIVAKVHKDRQMCEVDKIYPQYKLAQNKGYGTLEHRKSIVDYGYCPYHRKSFTFSL